MASLSLTVVTKRAKAPALLVTNLTNIRYLTGLNLSAGFVLIKAKKIVLYVDGRYLEVAQKEAAKAVAVKPMEDLEADLQKTKKCAFESEAVTVARLSNWKRKFKNTKFVQSRGVIEVFRREKRAEEIKNFKKAQRITQKVMGKIPSVLKPGITEREVAEQIRRFAVDFGADELSFEPIVAFGSNSASPHHHPGKTKLRKRDIIQIDCGARVNGYCADQSAVFFTGKPTAEQKRVYEAVEKAQIEAIKTIKAGVSNRTPDRVARNVLKKYELEEYFVHSLGHGVGLDIHEGPSLSTKAVQTKLKRNEIVTVEPGVYLPGKFGIRLEQEIIVV